MIQMLMQRVMRVIVSFTQVSQNLGLGTRMNENKESYHTLTSWRWRLPMSDFWFAFLAGLFIGANVGLVVFALLNAARER